MRTENQSTLFRTDELQIANYERVGRRSCCPDCGQLVGDSKGTHGLPDAFPATKVFGWKCEKCNNVLPSHTESAEARTFNDRICGVYVEFRDGSERWIPVPKASLTERESFRHRRKDTVQRQIEAGIREYDDYRYPSGKGDKPDQ